MHPRSLISAIVIRYLESIACRACSIQNFIFLAISVADETGLKPALSDTPKTGFLATRPIYKSLNNTHTHAYLKTRTKHNSNKIEARTNNTLSFSFTMRPILLKTQRNISTDFIQRILKLSMIQLKSCRKILLWSVPVQ